MSGFGYPDRFTEIKGGPQYTPLYSGQNTKPMPESENKEITAQRDELLEALVILMFWLNSGSAPSEHAIEMANQAIAKVKGGVRYE